MPKLETVARLLGYEYHPAIHIEGPWWSRGSLECDTPPLYDTDANASRELLAHVAKERRVIEFVTDLHRIIGDAVISDCGSNWAMLNATPQQIYDAFCATFARELEQVEKQP